MNTTLYKTPVRGALIAGAITIAIHLLCSLGSGMGDGVPAMILAALYVVNVSATATLYHLFELKVGGTFDFGMPWHFLVSMVLLNTLLGGIIGAMVSSFTNLLRRNSTMRSRTSA